MESVPPALSKKILIFFCLGLDIRVPEVVDTRPLFGTRNPGAFKNTPECVMNRSFGIVSAIRSRKKRSVLRRSISGKRGVPPASFSQFRGHGYVAVFPEFAVPYGQYAAIQIHIPHGKIECFRDTQPTAVEHTEQQ